MVHPVLVATNLDSLLRQDAAKAPLARSPHGTTRRLQPRTRTTPLGLSRAITNQSSHRDPRRPRHGLARPREETSTRPPGPALAPVLREAVSPCKPRRQERLSTGAQRKDAESCVPDTPDPPRPRRPTNAVHDDVWTVRKREGPLFRQVEAREQGGPRNLLVRPRPPLQRNLRPEPLPNPPLDETTRPIPR